MIKEDKKLTFEERYKSFKEGKTESAPVLYKNFQLKKVNKMPNMPIDEMPEDMDMMTNTCSKAVVISVEEKDRDGETVLMDGCIMRSWIKENGLPMIDSHDSYSTITTNGLGAMRNCRIEDVGGKKGFVAEPDFAPTPAGKIAEILYMGVNGGKPYFTNVSMGFAVYDYNNDTREILEWEPFECSLVTVGANMSARFMDKTKKAETEETTEKMAKDLARFKQIHEPFKEFCKLFLSEEFCKLIDYEKNGDLLLDINSLYDIIYKKFTVITEAPKITKEAPIKLQRPIISSDAINVALSDAISKQLDKFLQ